MAKKIDVILLAGFLGAGKTTVLNELIRYFHHVRLGMLVNDFGEVPVDGTLLKNGNPEILAEGHKVYEIGNGSIFCSCLKAPFLFGLKYFEKERPDILFIEASGLSDPFGFGKILTDHGLDASFDIRSVVTLVDPVKYTALVHVLEVISRQVASADFILINKADLVTPEKLAEVEKEVRTLNSRAHLQTGTFGRFDYAVLEKTEHLIRENEPAGLNTPDSRPASLLLAEKPADTPALKAFLDQIEGDIYRLKGFLEMDGVITYISDNGRGFSFTPVEKNGIQKGLTVLCPKEKADKIMSLWEVLG